MSRNFSKLKANCTRISTPSNSTPEIAPNFIFKKSEKNLN